MRVGGFNVSLKIPLVAGTIVIDDDTANVLFFDSTVICDEKSNITDRVNKKKGCLKSRLLF